MSERESQLISSACDVRLLVQWHRLSPHSSLLTTRASLTRLPRALENLENGGTGASLTRLPRALENLENGGTGASLTWLPRALENLENGGTGASLTRLPHALEHAGEELESKVVASTRSEATLPGPESSLCFMPAP